MRGRSPPDKNEEPRPVTEKTGLKLKFKSEIKPPNITGFTVMK